MDRELLLIAIYCMVEDFCKQPAISGQLKRVGHKPKLSDEAVLSLALLQEFTGITDEDDYWRYVVEHFEAYFPGRLVDRSQYHRRKKNLNPLINSFRLQLVKQLPTIPGHHIIDCLGTSAVTVTKFFGSQSFPNAGVGFCASKQLYYAGYKTATIVSFTGVLEDFVVGSAEPHDTPFGEALLAIQSPGIYLGDKGFILKQEEQQLLEAKGVRLLTAKRKNMKAKTPDYVKRLLKRYRSMVETVNGHLTELFSYNKPGGKSERGLLSRLNYKLAAHTTGQVILHRLGRPITNLDWLTGVCRIHTKGFISMRQVTRLYDDRGVALLEIVLLIVVTSILGFVGYRAWQVRYHKSAEQPQTFNKQVPQATTPNVQNILQIKELGVQMTLPAGLTKDDIYYQANTTASTSSEEGPNPRAINLLGTVVLSTHSLTAKEPSCGTGSRGLITFYKYQENISA